MICVQVYLKCDDGFNGAAQRIAANSPVFQGGTLLEPTTVYTPSPARYDSMTYNHVGASGLKLPAVSLGFWHNFGDITPYDTMRQIVFTAFDNGVTHFDLANNYGPEPGSAEKNCGRLLHEYFHHHRDELIISTKAGYEMWLGPYGDLGSRKYLLASLDQSLERLGLDYVDIFYHHHMDSHTPLEETMGALATAVHSGKALYVGLSNYDGPTLEQATAILDELHVPFIINQNRYNIFDRTVERNGLKETAHRLGKGLLGPCAGFDIDRLAILHQIHRDHGKLQRCAALNEEDLIVIGDPHQITQILLSLVDDGLDTRPRATLPRSRRQHCRTSSSARWSARRRSPAPAGR